MQEQNSGNQSEKPSLERGDTNQIRQVASSVFSKWRLILLTSFGAALITLGFNFLIPTYYKAATTLLPETEKSKLSSLGQFADVAALAGVNIPGSEIARLYPSIITSETVLLDIINEKYESKDFGRAISLLEYYELDRNRPELSREIALNKIRADLSASFDAKTSIVTVSLVMKEAQLAADVLNALVMKLDDFMRRKRVTSASEQVKWAEVRLRQVDQDLRTAENSLKAFREKNRRVSDSPELLLQQERLAREVQVNSAVFVELKKQLELAKLDEIKNLSIVNVLDPARAPALKAGPKRATNSVIVFLVAVLLGAAYFVVKPLYGDQIKQYVRHVIGHR